MASIDLDSMPTYRVLDRAAERRAMMFDWIEGEDDDE